MKLCNRIQACSPFLTLAYSVLCILLPYSKKGFSVCVTVFLSKGNGVERDGDRIIYTLFSIFSLSLFYVLSQLWPFPLPLPQWKRKKNTHFLVKREPLLLQSQRVSVSNGKDRSVYHLQLLCQCVTTVKVSFLAISSLYVSALWGHWYFSQLHPYHLTRPFYFIWCWITGHSSA